MQSIYPKNKFIDILGKNIYIYKHKNKSYNKTIGLYGFSLFNW